MKAEGERRMKRFSLVLLCSIFGVIAILLIVATKVMGIPMIAGYDDKFILPSATTKYSLVQCADFQTPGIFKKVCAGPGSQIPTIDEDLKAFEDNFNLMMVFAEKEIPFTSWLYVVKFDQESSETFVHLFNGERIYASGAGDTFATAMDDLMTSFFSYDHMADEAPDLAAALKNDIEI